MFKKHPVKLFAAYFFFNNVMTAIASVQRIPYLKFLGYDARQRSIILSALALLSIIGQLYIGFISDKYKTVKKISLVIIVLWASSSFFLYNFNEQLFLYHFILLVLSGSIQNVQVDLNDSWALQSGEKIRGNFSLIKGFQSLGYVSGTILTSILITSFGYNFLARIILLFGIVLFSVAAFINDRESSSSKEKIRLKDVKVLLQSKTYMLALLMFMCLFTITQIHAIAIAEKILYLGGNETHIAMRVVIAVGLEAVAYMFCDKIYKKIGAFKMLFISAIGYIVMYSLFIFAYTPLMMVAFAGLQIFCVPPFIVSMKHLVFDLSPNQLKSTGQLFVTATMVGISGTLTPIMLGYLTYNYSVNHALASAIFFALLAIVMIGVVKRQVDKEILLND